MRTLEWREPECGSLFTLRAEYSVYSATLHPEAMNDQSPARRKTYAEPRIELLGHVAALTATRDKLEGDDPAGSGPMNPPSPCHHPNYPFCGCRR